MKILMPQLGETVTEGTIVAWHRRDGDAVAADEVLFEIETDKVATEVPAPTAGVLRAIEVAKGLEHPWGLAFLPDGRMLVTEKVGPLWLVTQDGQKTRVDNVPDVVYGGQGGMLGVYVSPHYARDQSIYLTYSEPNEGGSSLALTRARLSLGSGSATLEDPRVIWHDPAGEPEPAGDAHRDTLPCRPSGRPSRRGRRAGLRRDEVDRARKLDTEASGDLSHPAAP